MPRIRENRFDYMVRDRVKQLHGELLAEGIRDVEVARWLNCSSQNASAHFRNASFTYKQILIIRERLREVKEANKRKEEMAL